MDTRYDTELEETADARLLGLRRNDLLVLLVGIVVLLVAMWLMNRWLFPDGTGLGDGQGQSGSVTWNAQDGSRDFAVFGAADNDADPVARLARVQRAVKLRAANQVAWSGVEAGARLHDRDAVQTLARSAASIAFGERSSIELGANSLIVIQTTGRDAFVPRRRSTLVLQSGELHGTLAASAAKSAAAGQDDVDIELPFGRLRVFGGDAARFKVGLNPDNTATVSIFGGSAELRAAGKAVRIGANQGVTFGADDVEFVVRDLPGMPIATAPANASVVRFGDLPPPVRFAWGGGQPAHYRFVLARGVDFADVLVDERLRQPYFDYDNLEDGEYFWKVTAVRGWQESPPSAARSVSLVRDRAPPKLELLSDYGVSQTGSFEVKGHTEPGARVLIAGQPVSPARNGYFEYEMKLDPGANLVVVEAIDDVGNIAFKSQVVHSAVRQRAGEVH